MSTKLFAKPTDRPGYIHNKSYHPKLQLKNISYGQTLRAKCVHRRRRFKETVNQLKTSFQSRGYKESQINEQLARMNSTITNSLHKENREDNNLNL